MTIKRGPVIAIDGPGGVGKTTASKLLAKKLGLKYIDTGAMYRAVAVAANEAGIDIENETALERFCSGLKVDFNSTNGGVTINGADFSSKIRTPEATRLSSIVSTKKPVRDFLVKAQRELGREGSVVMEGRDIGTVVFPGADIKFFFDASPEIRAARRHQELAAKHGIRVEDVQRELAERDKRDESREHSPLKKADDAILIDTSTMNIDEVVETLASRVKERLG